MNDIKTTQDNSQRAIAMLKETILAVLQQATESGEGIGPSAIRDKLEIREESLPNPPVTLNGERRKLFILFFICLKRMGLHNEVHWIKKMGAISQ